MPRDVYCGKNRYLRCVGHDNTVANVLMIFQANCRYTHLYFLRYLNFFLPRHLCETSASPTSYFDRSFTWLRRVVSRRTAAFF